MRPISNIKFFQRHLLYKLFSEAEIRESNLKICILKFEILVYPG